jgi:hypothetical protein
MKVIRQSPLSRWCSQETLCAWTLICLQVMYQSDEVNGTLASTATILASPTAEAAIRNRQRVSRRRVCMNVRFGLVVTESAVS